MKYHVVSAKRFGWDDNYEHFFFPVKEYSMSDALAEFQKVEKYTVKYNKTHPYTAYEYEGEAFYSIEYRGIADESEI
ncbi:MAG: hypothetical protein ABGX20_21350 [Bacillus sp. (in: firmicutes)]